MAPPPSSPSASRSEAENKRILGIVFFTVFLDLVGFGIIIPIQPFYAESLGAHPSTVTLLGASFSLMQFLFAPFWGRLSDKIGRRPVMLVSIASTVVGYFIFGLSGSLTILFLSRMLAGFGSANIGTAQAIIADSTTPEKRAKGMGLIGAAFGLGFIFGPALGGSLVRFGLAVPAFVAAGLSAINLVLAFFILPETRTAGAKSVVVHRAFSWKALKHAARHPNVGQLFTVFLTYTLAFSLMEQVLGLFIEKTWLFAEPASVDHSRHAATYTMYVLVVVGVTATIIQGGLIGRLVKAFGERRLLLFGIGAVSISLAMIPVVGWYFHFAMLLPVSMCLAIGTGLINPSLSSLLSRAVDPDEQGGAMGMGQSLAALGRVIGPSAAGFLFEWHPNVPFWIGAGLTCVCGGIASTIKPQRK